MKYLKYTVLVFIFCACNNKEAKEKVNVETSLPTVSVIPSKPVEALAAPATLSDSSGIKAEYDYELLDVLIRQDIIELDKKYPSSPYYMLLDNEKHFVVSDGSQNYGIPDFNGQIQYGIVDSGHTPILPVAYDKIYNPDLTLEECFELKKGKKVGLFNYALGTVLPPQFDIIYPAKGRKKRVAYGLKEGVWFKIKNDLSTSLSTDFSPVDLFKSLSFNLKDSKNIMMFSSYNESYPEDLGTGKGVLVLPSYLEQLNLLDKTFYDDIILPRQVGSNAGTKTVELKNTKDISITDKIKSFFISVYEEGIDARGYHSESEELVVYNSQNNQLNSYQLYSLDDSDQLCRDSGYRVLFDSLIEVKKTGSHHGGLGYDFGPIYQYHTVSSEGDLIPLKSDRYFDFTKFAKVEKRHFEGCYAKEIGMMIDQHNYVQSDHLTIEELDLMRNEIFADYGYKFKTEKWQKYFATKAWYKPLHDDVNDLLTDIDKANVKTILRIKKSMEGREQDVVNKRPIAFYAAG